MCLKIDGRISQGNLIKTGKHKGMIEGFKIIRTNNSGIYHSFCYKEGLNESCKNTWERWEMRWQEKAICNQEKGYKEVNYGFHVLKSIPKPQNMKFNIFNSEISSIINTYCKVIKVYYELQHIVAVGKVLTTDGLNGLHSIVVSKLWIDSLKKIQCA